MRSICTKHELDTFEVNNCKVKHMKVRKLVRAGKILHKNPKHTHSMKYMDSIPVLCTQGRNLLHNENAAHEYKQRI